jgi:hypothetical protein
VKKNKEIEKEKEELRKKEESKKADNSKNNDESKKVAFVQYVQSERPEPRPAKPIFNPFEFSDHPLYANLDYFYSLKNLPEYNPLKVVWIFRPPV